MYLFRIHKLYLVYWTSCNRVQRLDKVDLFYRTEKIVTMPVKGTEYHDGMNPEGRFQLYISGKNIDSGSMESTQISFVLKKPQLVIQVQTHKTISFCDRQGFFPMHIAAGNIFFCKVSFYMFLPDTVNIFLYL